MLRAGAVNATWYRRCAEILAVESVLDVPQELFDDDNGGLGALDDMLLTAENVEPTPKSILGYQYSVDCILKAWLLSRHLARVTPDLNAVVMLATSIGLQPEMADAVADALARGTLKLPGKEILRESHFRLNLLDLMYQRELHNSFFFFRALPQRGQFKTGETQLLRDS